MKRILTIGDGIKTFSHANSKALCMAMLFGRLLHYIEITPEDEFT